MSLQNWRPYDLSVNLNKKKKRFKNSLQKQYQIARMGQPRNSDKPFVLLTHCRRHELPIRTEKYCYLSQNFNQLNKKIYSLIIIKKNNINLPGKQHEGEAHWILNLMNEWMIMALKQKSKNLKI